MKNVSNLIDLSSMQYTLKGYRKSLGKETQPHHYVNEVGSYAMRYQGDLRLSATSSP